MNERIKQLALEAGYAAPELAGRMQKFADLLVADVVKVILEQRNPSTLNYKPSEKIADEIKHRYGVK